MALAKENHELHVVLRNSDAEGALLRQEKKFSRQLDKCRVYARSLENLLEEERKVRCLDFFGFFRRTLLR